MAAGPPTYTCRGPLDTGPPAKAPVSPTPGTTTGLGGRNSSRAKGVGQRCGARATRDARAGASATGAQPLRATRLHLHGASSVNLSLTKSAKLARQGLGR